MKLGFRNAPRKHLPPKKYKLISKAVKNQKQLAEA